MTASSSAGAGSGSGKAYTVARAYVQLKPSMKGFFNSINSELSASKMTGLGVTLGGHISKGMTASMTGSGGIVSSLGAMGGTSGSLFGKGFSNNLVSGTANAISTLTGNIGSGITSALSTAGDAIGNFATTTAKVAGTAVAAIGAYTVTGGVNRALTIENSEAKLKGLRHNATEIKSIMDSALTSVQGTIYSLNDASSLAANAVAAGIPMGQNLTKWLQDIADTSTIAGASLSDVGYVFQKIQAEGKVNHIALNQLQERGVPLGAMLSKEMGVSTEEMYKMMAKGQVSSAIFRKTIEDNFSGASLASANTTTGAFKNMGIAFSRFGAVIATAALPASHAFFISIGKTVDILKAHFGPQLAAMTTHIGDKLMPSIEAIPERFLAFLDMLKNGKGTGALLTSISNAFKDIKKDLSPVQGYLHSELPKALQYVAGLAAILVNKMFVGTDKQKSWFMSFIDGIRYVVREFKPFAVLIGSALPGIIKRVEGMFSSLYRTIFVPSKERNSWIGSIATFLTDNLPKIMNKVVPVFDDLYKKIFKGDSKNASWVSMLVVFVEQLYKVLKPVVTMVVTEFLPVIAKGLGSLIPFLGMALMNYAKIAAATVKAFGPVAMDLFVALVPVVKALVGMFIAATPAIIGFIQQLAGMASHVSKNKGLVQTLAVLWLTFFGGFKAMKGIISLVTGISKGVMGIVKVFEVFGGGIGRVIGLFGKLWGAGQRIFGFIKLFAELSRMGGLMGAIELMLPKLFSLITGFGKLVEVIKLWSGWTKIATALQAAFDFVMAINPWVLAVVAVVALVGALVWWFSQTKEGQQVWASLCKGVQDGLASITKWFGEFGSNIAKWWGEACATSAKNWNNVVKFFGDSIRNIGNWFNDTFSAIGRWFGDLADGIGKGLGTIGKWFNEVFGGIGKFITDFVSGITKAIDGAIKWVQGLTNIIPDWMRGAFGGTASSLTVNHQGSNLPKMATGGDILSATAVVVGEKEPESIVNRNLMNQTLSSVNRRLNDGSINGGNQHGGGDTYQITIQQLQGESPEQLAHKVVGYLESKQKRR